MNAHDKSAFDSLFTVACKKCFGHELTAPLSETDSRQLSAVVLECTGLVIGAKSIRNYSLFILGIRGGRDENPSVATLDTLARYVMDAPRTDEAQRRENEGNFPYWYGYRTNQSAPGQAPHGYLSRHTLVVAGTVVLLLVAGWILFLLPAGRDSASGDFVDAFNTVSEDSLAEHGWHVRNIDPAWWARRGERDGHLRLFTLPGDNWEGEAGIHDMPIRKVPSECFATEAHLSDFAPTQNWQQAGIILAEDSTFKGKVLRISISYNDFFGGFEKNPEILIQVLSSSETSSKSKPLELAHLVLFDIDPGFEQMVMKNSSQAALKIERHGSRYAFLYSVGETEGFAFHEVISSELNIDPHYAGIFAIQGISDNDVIAADFDSFSVVRLDCR